MPGLAFRSLAFKKRGVLRLRFQNPLRLGTGARRGRLSKATPWKPNLAACSCSCWRVFSFASLVFWAIRGAHPALEPLTRMRYADWEWCVSLPWSENPNLLKYQKNPRAHKNKIGTSPPPPHAYTPPPQNPKYPPPLNEEFYGHGVFLQKERNFSRHP